MADKAYPNLGVNEPEVKPGIVQRAVQAFKEGWENLRVGDGHATAMGRLGGHELTQALAAFPDSNVRPIEEPGVCGNPTAQIVSDEMGYNDMLDRAAARGNVQAQDQSQGIER
ncbi:hypothetical protein ACYOEI_17620 [Singulisphaera rosea]